MPISEDLDRRLCEIQWQTECLVIWSVLNTLLLGALLVLVLLG